ncbi:hypothetical protein HU200_037472 [Digitaria exilis]|uniref:TCP domain-containing protein n=1 Tax=Digitaria exilis TaxID=1010633 RepID=A0A835EL58_9POAL|nr:hypothetical protein HU200_037472 [Digitaria exilis]
MLPYPNPHHHFGVSQEPPNPTASFPMLPPAAAHLDHHHHHHHYVVDHFFPGHGHHHFNSETLEAVLRPPRSAHPEPEAAAAVVTAPPPGAGRNAGGGQAGHARARKRPFRTDRHSKIRTAQGVRDRRMRLSLDVARDFFALQDRLGFDKASKTVDWLLTQSKPAIDRLTDDHPSSHQRSGGSDVALSPPTSGAPASHGSGKRGDVVEMGITRNGVSAFMEHSSCELDRLVSAVAPAIGAEYYYTGLGEMMSNSGGDQGDEDGEYEEDGDDEFLDGMQY